MSKVSGRNVSATNGKSANEDSAHHNGDAKVVKSATFQFKEGNMVYVNEHAWPGVNNPEGIAKILDAYENDEGQPVYDIKYIVGGKKTGVLEEYLCLHDF